MSKAFYIFPLMLSAMLMVGGCAKEKCQRIVTTKLFTPILKSQAEVRATAVQVQAPQEIGSTGKIYISGRYIFVNEPGKGVHIIDNQYPASPVKVSFIKVEGNRDMAVKGNILYVDSYRDLVAIDITDPTQVRKVKTLEDVLGYAWDENGYVVGYKYYGQSDTMVVGYTSRDTAYTCDCQTGGNPVMFANASFSSLAGEKASAASNSKGGSMARFTIAKDYLYTVDISSLMSFNIQNPADPVFNEQTAVGWGGIETIFPYGDNLFIGSRSAMFIYSLANPAKPERKSAVTHFTACDPVVVEGTTAYVTIRSGNVCSGTLNQLLVYDVKDVEKPVKLATYDLKNPHGLGIDNGKLFVCEGVYGLRFMNASNPAKISTYKLVEGLNAYDVIPYNSENRLLVSAADGIYQYNYSSMSQPVLVSKIKVTKPGT
ncbi:hypothetical protein DLD77_08445 [Chitinophaga alhagiae]|uniref:LVIVD repeat-containing protein n=2 Tax=Chitinophaga alhagiae TaxID=2203219 RepID=A0ABN5LR97_9BACT|nr:hypothetical protein [Chitinophaga alhagiae]AWO01727.1 hypothetical protein DLD77_08445 [Chitinophaga alhagiae]